MKYIAFVIMLFILISGCTEKPFSDKELWFNNPARQWVEALPVGNGRLAAMIYGKVDKEVIKLNESSLWSGGPVNPNPNPEAYQYLSVIREAINKGEFEKATQLCKKMQGNWTASFSPLGDLLIDQAIKGEVQNYRRKLDLNTAIASTSFSADGVNYSREVYASFGDDVIVVKLKSNKKGTLNFDLSTQSLLQPAWGKISNTEIEMTGKSPAIVEPSYVEYATEPVVFSDSILGKGTRFSLRIKVIENDGKVHSSDKVISINDATEVTVLISAATSFNGFDKKPDTEGRNESELSKEFLKMTEGKSYIQLKDAHLLDYQKYFNRVNFNLEGKSHPELPTNERLDAYSKGGQDAGLEALYFHFGRYLLISSSRPGGLPANLQGIWNENIRPPWSSNYTTNINVEMNYWIAEACNLSELHEPLFSLIKNLSVTGAETAKNYYQANGWCVHHNTDIWATSNPVGDLGRLGDAKWANWTLAGPWLCQHLWEHYQFTGDNDFLKNTAYPLMKGAAQFCSDWLILSPDGKYLVTSPSVSPENVFKTKNGFAEVSMASTIDMSLIRELFTNVIQASGILSTDEPFRNELFEKLPRLFPFQVGKKGDLQEWFLDFEAKDPKHRHLSHLYGLYPGNEITMAKTPELAKACEKSLDLHGDEGAGWSKAWKINLLARLLDGEKSYVLLRELLTLSNDFDSKSASAPEAASIGSGGTYPNLFCAGPPFQIDGNFGGTAGINEMLLQSQANEIHLLPAIPKVWANGNFKGLKARGGFEVDAEWENGLPVKVTIQSNLGNDCVIRSACSIKADGINLIAEKQGDYFMLKFKTKKGVNYILTAN
jgi:alpha-L-fucosidase 2